MKLIYIIAPYRGTPEEVKLNISRASYLADLVNRYGGGELFAMCPHTMTGYIRESEQPTDEKTVLEGLRELASRCDAGLVLLNEYGIEPTRGMRDEIAVIHSLNKPCLVTTFPDAVETIRQLRDPLKNA